MPTVAFNTALEILLALGCFPETSCTCSEGIGCPWVELLAPGFTPMVCREQHPTCQTAPPSLPEDPIPDSHAPGDTTAWGRDQALELNESDSFMSLDCIQSHIACVPLG